MMIFGYRQRAVFVFRKMWITESTLRVRFIGGTDAQRSIAREQAGWWSEHANLRFEFNDAPNAEIRIAFDDNDGAWSYIGTDATQIPLHLPTMNLGFLDGGDAYPGRRPEAVELPVIDTAGVAADIGAPGEEDLFRFSVTRAGRHTIETGGQTDVVMKLFGPGSQTALIAEDDDGGQGLNSKIVADLLPGDYYVQVRHYNSHVGAGQYSITVST